MVPAFNLPFSLQRIIFSSLLFVVITFMAVVALMVPGDGPGLAPEPMAAMDLLAVVFGAITLVAGLFLRWTLHRRADQKQGDARRQARFLATLVPLAVLEGGCLLALVVWMTNGYPLPGLVVALILLSVMIAILPFRDPEAHGAS